MEAKQDKHANVRMQTEWLPRYSEGRIIGRITQAELLVFHQNSKPGPVLNIIMIHLFKFHRNQQRLDREI